MSKMILIDESSDDLIASINAKLDEVLCRPTTEKKEYLRMEEVAEFLDVDVRTVQNYKSKGIIGYTAVERGIYFKRSELLDLLERNYIPPRPSCLN